MCKNKKEFWTLKKATKVENIRHITIHVDMSNDKMERFNSEIISSSRKRGSKFFRRESSDSVNLQACFSNDRYFVNPVRWTIRVPTLDRIVSATSMMSCVETRSKYLYFLLFLMIITARALSYLQYF